LFAIVQRISVSIVVDCGPVFTAGGTAAAVCINPVPEAVIRRTKAGVHPIEVVVAINFSVRAVVRTISIRIHIVAGAVFSAAVSVYIVAETIIGVGITGIYIRIIIITIDLRRVAIVHGIPVAVGVHRRSIDAVAIPVFPITEAIVGIGVNTGITIITIFSTTSRVVVPISVSVETFRTAGSAAAFINHPVAIMVDITIAYFFCARIN
jgi:hypothetical protein